MRPRSEGCRYKRCWNGEKERWWKRGWRRRGTVKERREDGVAVKVAVAAVVVVAMAVALAVTAAWWD